jgi:CheY-like chemotaxis protein/anti-sigma regulatory factor (Ser/Thr protein kinase)
MEAIGRLAGGVAHDFNNILTAIIGYSQLAMNSIDPFDPLNSLLKDIYNAGEQATSLTYQLLAFSRRQMLKSVVINVNTLINNMQHMLRRLISENIEIVTLLDPDLGNIKSDRSQMEQVLLNLIINAKDALLHGGKIVIETKNITIENKLSNIVDIIPGDYIQITVNDNGHGMDKEVQSRIFEPFFTTKDKSRGTGLGLSTVYGIIKQSLGKISVYSEPDRGATFKIYLPRVDQQVDIEKESAVISERLEGSETILVVEDNENVRDLVCKGLRFYSYNVLNASKPEEALKICLQNKDTIKLVVTDVVMPQMSGQELARILTEKYPMIKILFISGFTDSAIVHYGILDSGMAFLQKPFTPDKLAGKIREILDAG